MNHVSHNRSPRDFAETDVNAFINTVHSPNPGEEGRGLIAGAFYSNFVRV